MNDQDWRRLQMTMKYKFGKIEKHWRGDKQPEGIRTTKDGENWHGLQMNKKHSGTSEWITSNDKPRKKMNDQDWRRLQMTMKYKFGKIEKHWRGDKQPEGIRTTKDGENWHGLQMNKKHSGTSEWIKMEHG